MTDKQSNHVDMILNTIRVYDDNQAVIDSKPDVGIQKVFPNAGFGLPNGRKWTPKEIN